MFGFSGSPDGWSFGGRNATGFSIRRCASFWVTVLETRGRGGDQERHGKRIVPLLRRVVRALRTWRRAQFAERLAAGPAWADLGLVFTMEDGSAVAGQWVSFRFEILAFRAGLPPIQFHDLRHGVAPTNQRPRISQPPVRTSTPELILGTTAPDPRDARCQRWQPGGVVLPQVATQRSVSRPGEDAHHYSIGACAAR
jgi:hypothetical protein